MLASEFGRDAITEGKVGKEVKDQAKTPDVMSEPKHYGMHRHFTAAGRCCSSAAGLREVPLRQDRRRAALHDYRESGPCGGPARHHLPRAGHRADQSFVVEKRPVYVTKDGKGKVVNGVYA